jgi:biopolymer transport protein ExbB/TolQ
MRSKTKSILALAGTLVLGMVLGGLIASQVFRSRINHFRDLRQKKNFTSRILDVTGASAQQEAAIRPILDNFGQEMEAMHQHHLDEVKASHQALHDSLASYLDADQIASLEKEFRRMTGRAHRMMRDGGHHPHGGKRKKLRHGE